MIIAMLFCLGDMEKAQDSPTDYPFMEVFAAATGSTSGAAVMISIIIIMQLCADVGLLAAASRMLWSFARDRGLPGGVYIARVRPLNPLLIGRGKWYILTIRLLGQFTHFYTHNLHPCDYDNQHPPFTHHLRFYHRVQQPCLHRGCRPLFFLPMCRRSTSLSPLHRWNQELQGVPRYGQWHRE